MAKKGTESKSWQSPITLKALLSAPLARQAFEELTQNKGVDKEKLLSLLRRIPFLSNKAQRLVEGMEDRTVRRLPDRIRFWADAVEKVNGSPWLSPDSLRSQTAEHRNSALYPKPLDLILTPEWAEPTAKLFGSLPRNLRLYADYLRAQLEFFHPTSQRRIELGFRRKPVRVQRSAVLELLAVVRKSAARPCYKEIATLLDATFAIAGKTRPRFTYEENLSKLERNNPWEAWVVREFANRG